MILAVTVLLSAIVISINQVAEIPRGKELLLYALDGVCMEIPQRMMMQTFSGVLFMAGHFLDRILSTIIRKIRR